MGNSSNSSLTNLVVLATLSSTVLSLSYDDSTTLIPEVKPDYAHHMNLADWKDNAFNISTDYTIQDDYSEKIQTILGFSKKILDNSKDLDSEYVDIVNENFWDLV